MNKSELKKILKPIVKECIKESLYESGVLSSIISEVVQGVVSGTNKTVLEETTTTSQPHVDEERRVDEARAQQKLQQLKNKKEKLLNAIGQSAYNGVNVFEGTEPLKSGGSPSGKQATGPMRDRDPNDPGVNIDALTNQLGGVWKKLAEGRKK